jgi:catechol 2,3-dioxygenase-like lactoylglutathione lyase family enzyme
MPSGILHNCFDMKIEHFALQVADPVATADWYKTHLGCTLVRAGGEPTRQRFLSDSSGRILLEFYRNPRLPVPDYLNMDPLLLHVAFVSSSPASDRERLVAAGARVVEDVTVAPNGDKLVMLRDPWGLAVQLVKRAKPMLKSEDIKRMP